MGNDLRVMNIKLQEIVSKIVIEPSLPLVLIKLSMTLLWALHFYF